LGTLIPFDHHHAYRHHVSDGEEDDILSAKHKEILKSRLENKIKSVTTRDFEVILREVPDHLSDIHCSKAFVSKMVSRIILLYNMLFDTGFPIPHSAEKTIAGGLMYFISQENLFPDEIPGLGYLDDAYVIKKTCEKACHQAQEYIEQHNLDIDKYL
jgi:uncharacterized membrane protein YkvA (DUF1232 family)